MDVGAGGLRLSAEEPLPAPGSAVHLEIVLDNPEQPQGPPRLVLDGTGRVVWVRTLAEDTGSQVGVRFDAPVDVRQSFPDVSIY